MRWMAMNNAYDDRPDQADQAKNMSSQQEYAEVTNLRPTVGDELRMRREEAGHTIEDLSEALRIQKRYLEALENGRIDDLPGTVYALGFLRTYAEYYGFDGDTFVTRYKEETEGWRKEQELALPEPLEEARVPTAAIALVGIVLAIGAIVMWYSMRPQEAEIASAVPEVPASLAAPAEEASPPSAQAEPEPARQPEPVPEPAPAAASSAAPVTASEEPALAIASTEAETPPLAPVAEAETPPPAPVAETPAAPQPPVAQTEPDMVVAETPDAQTTQPETTAQETRAAAEAGVAVMTPPGAGAPDTPDAPAVEETVHVQQVYGATEDPRIVIAATDDSWIEITDAEGSRLMSRTLRAGDSYRVPNRDGLVFVTGNAGGLAITVDGEPVPAIGGIGIVRKNVKLDPELLKEGRAWP